MKRLALAAAGLYERIEKQSGNFLKYGEEIPAAGNVVIWMAVSPQNNPIAAAVRTCYCEVREDLLEFSFLVKRFSDENTAMFSILDSRSSSDDVVKLVNSIGCEFEFGKVNCYGTYWGDRRYFCEWYFVEYVKSGNIKFRYYLK